MIERQHRNASPFVVGALALLLLTSERALAEPRAYEQTQAPPPAAEAPPSPAKTAPATGEAPPKPSPATAPAPPHAASPPGAPTPSAQGTPDKGDKKTFKEAREEEQGKAATEALPSIGPRHDGTNYFLVNAHDFRRGETGLVKFRIDLEYDITRIEKWPRVGFFYLTFPLRFINFWDLFDALPGSRSSPFVETNYAPGLEVSWVSPRSGLTKVSEDAIKGERNSVSFGLLHESNGLGTLAGSSSDQFDSSRGWNRWYLTGRLVFVDQPVVLLTSSLTVWYPWGSDVVDGWPDGSKAQTRLQDYLGYGEALARLRIHLGTWLDFSTRVVLRQHSVEAEVRWSLKRAQLTDGLALEGNGFRLDLLFDCFSGKGERLMVANETHTSCYVGLGL